MILSSARDKTIIMWNLTHDKTNYGVPQCELCGSLSLCQQCGHLFRWTVCSFRLLGWNTEAEGSYNWRHHMLVCRSHQRCHRQIVSGSQDKTIKLWNTLGVCKYTVQEESHSECVFCVRFSPNSSNPIIVSCGWEKMVKVWNLANCKLKTNHIGHSGCLNTVNLIRVWQVTIRTH
ncbi:hypothetical protein XELAEV_18013331mg [Xenopus laevis]|uniref:Small ribosomal subunit protein RACK1 n=1 Tax=Xenopus laevis TaxID=8355 RepID=A0A974HZ93_XENLA|nr:hypothetical protein XELAEV_18013331mg [Xenopus laevis]